MTDDETNALMKHANDCVEGECSIDEVSDLLNVLKNTEKELEDRLEKIMNMVAHLQHVNEKESRKTDEVRAFVKDMLRVFSTDVSFYFQNEFFLYKYI
jgi:DNA repair exonuclease SbcCD ATPase subunit